jgi:assimilatory nitrate reductase electron transfer subunit
MGDVSPNGTDCVEGTEVLQFVDATRGTYKKVVVSDGRVTGAIFLGDASTVGAVTQLFDRGAAAPHDRLALLFDGGRSADAQTPARIPDRATICRCNGVTKGAITACWFDGARSTDEVAARTRATTGCGTCRDTVDGIVRWLADAAAEERIDCA